MKHRNPLFVAGFPYALLLAAYFVLQILGQSIMNNDGQIPSSARFPLIGALSFALIGGGYYLYWLIATARTLRQETDEKIPPAILLVIPFANYWWLWRYSVAAEKYTKGKLQAALGFLVLFMVGSVGAGILQDYYNKSMQATK